VARLAAPLPQHFPPGSRYVEMQHPNRNGGCSCPKK
jgi:hypothetical protein